MNIWQVCWHFCIANLICILKYDPELIDQIIGWTIYHRLYKNLNGTCVINFQRAHIQKSIIHVLESNPVEDKAALEAELRIRQEEEEKLKAQEKAYQVNYVRKLDCPRFIQ